jgi:proline dehydrogenase
MCTSLSFCIQFVGGDTARDVIPLLEQLRAENKGVLFAYSVEVHETEASGKALKQGTQPPQATHKKIVDEMIRAIDVAAAFEDKHGHGNAAGRRTWVAVKMVSKGRAQLVPHV